MSGRVTAGALVVWIGVAGGMSPATANDADLRTSVKRAIERAQNYLIQQQLPDGSWSKGRVGRNAIVLLALSNSGLDARHPTIENGLKYLRKSPIPDNTYDISLMIMALAAVRDGKRDAGLIFRLAEILESNQRNSGGWHYYGSDSSWDNSCTQYALLGLREAAFVAGYQVDRGTWRKARDHWLREQGGSRESVAGAGWTYNVGRGNSTGSMTVAGIGSLAIIDSFLQEDPPDGTLNCCGAAEKDEVQAAIDAGVRWLGNRFSVRDNPGGGNWLLYYLYGLERAGRLSGRRFFGDHDWYREGARFLVESQVAATGAWREDKVTGDQDDNVSTSFALLFLSKGLAPVLVNKLKFGPRNPATGEPIGDDWNRHPNDVRNLVDYISGRDRWPSLLTWQVVDFDKAIQEEGVQALLQAPVQLLSGAGAPDSIQGKQVELLREYIAQGGFLLAIQNCEDGGFDAGFRELIKRMFPTGEFRLRKLPDTHDVYRTEFLIDESPPELWGVDFGCRTAIIYAPFDHACRWEHWSSFDPPGRSADLKGAIGRSMKLGTNIVAYATNREVHDKLDGPEALLAESPSDESSRGTIRLARIRHTGGWDTARNSARHLLDALEKKVGLRPASRIANLPTTDPDLFDFPLLYMHGRQNFTFSAAEREQLKRHLENGGLLFADACCGAEAFDTAFRLMIEQTFGQPLERIPISHELFYSDWGNDIRQVERRLPRDERRGSVLDTELSIGEPVLEGLTVNGRLAVIYSKYDLSCALERQATSACAGYTTEDATRIAVNIVLYSFLQKVETTSR
ncbi:MAG: DUF4159 domain-containing protein [Planctomycetaceae bacterium]|nr:DUF4159 domain-containing protein [Planctomycetaceae bacterium]